MPILMDIEYGTLGGSRAIEQGNDIAVIGSKYERTYLVIGDSLSDTEDTILDNTLGLPIIGITSIGTAVCASLDPTETDIVISPFTGARVGYWKVKATFDSSTPKKENDDPTKAAPVINYEGESHKKVLEFDAVTGERITTTAGEPVLVEDDDEYDVMRITRYEKYPYDPRVRQLYRKKVNAMRFMGYPVGTVRLAHITSDEETINNKKYCKVSYIFKINTQFDTYTGSLLSNTWTTKFLNNGYLYRKEKFGKPEVYLDKKGHPIKVNLDKDGLLLQDASGSTLSMYSGTNKDSTCRPVSPDTYVVEPDDIGSILTVYAATNWTPGDYLVTGVQVVSVNPVTYAWVVRGNTGTPFGSSNAPWYLHRSPIYRTVNRYQSIDFNMLGLDVFGAF